MQAQKANKKANMRFRFILMAKTEPLKSSPSDHWVEEKSPNSATGSPFFHRGAGTFLIMWANGGWLCSWDGFSRGYTLVAPAGRVPADPWNMPAIAKLRFTVFHGIARSKRLVMSKVAKSRWHDNWVFITFLFCMLTPALARLRTWVTLKITFMTKEGGGCENNGEKWLKRWGGWWNTLAC